MTDDRLDVWLEGAEAPIGRIDRAPSKAIRFRYTAHAIEHGRALSMSLPLSDATYPDAATRGYFDNLLQEGTNLTRIRDRFGIDLDDTGALLALVGRECAGAVSVVPVGDSPGKTPGQLDRDYQPVDDSELAQELAALVEGRPIARARRFSLAGVQSKIAIAVDPASGAVGSFGGADHPCLEGRDAGDARSRGKRSRMPAGCPASRPTGG